MPNYNFWKDLPIAKETEKEIAYFLEKHFNSKILNFENTNKYDLLVDIDNGIQVKIEIKEDFTCEKTGNIGLEFECRGKPSGLNATEADYYIYKVHTPEHKIEYIMHHTSTLKKMVEDKRYFRIVNGGDRGSNSMNYLFKYDIFKKYGKALPFNYEDYCNRE